MRRLPLAALFFAAACSHTSGAQGPDVERGRQKVLEAQKQAESGDKAKAAQRLGEIARTYGESEVAAEALFTQGQILFEQPDYAGARKVFRELLTRFPLFPKSDEVKYRLGLSALKLDEGREAYQTLSPLFGRMEDARRLEAAQAIAQAAESARLYPEAAHWCVEGLKWAKDEPARAALLQRVSDLVEGKIAFLDVARLAEDTPKSNPAWPFLKMKLARIYFHLRDASNLRSALNDLIDAQPQGPFAQEAKELLARVEPAQEVKTDLVGVVLPMSGKFKAYGEAVMQGIGLALGGEKDKSKVRLVVKDSAGDPAVARKAVQELALDDRVVAIIGPVLTSEAELATSEAEMLEVPLITLSRAEGITDQGSYIFRNMLTNSAQARALADYAVRVRKMSKFAMLYPNIPYGVELANEFWDEVEERGGEVRGAERYEHDQTTFGPPIKRIVGREYLDEREDFKEEKKRINTTVKDPFRKRKEMEAMVKKLPPYIDFDAIFIPDYPTNVGLLAPSLAVEDIVTNACDTQDVERIKKTLGVGELKTVLLLGANGWDFDELVERAGKFVQCSVFVDGFFAKSDREPTRAFVQAFRTSFGKDPGLLEAYGYDTAAMVRAVVEKSQPKSRPAFRDSLLKLKDFPGATGRISFNERREAERPLFFLTIDREAGIREIDSEHPPRG